jgi:hypothetical protein
MDGLPEALFPVAGVMGMAPPPVNTGRRQNRYGIWISTASLETDMVRKRL